MKSDEQVIELRNVVKKYNGKSKIGKHVILNRSGKKPGQYATNGVALDHVSLSVKKGEFLVVMGKSGSGKSTLLNVITGIDTVTEGEIVVNGTPIHRMDGSRLAHWRGLNVGIVFQFFQLMPTLTVLENVMLPMEFTSIIPNKEQKERARALLDKVDILQLANKFPNSISGGEKQRAAIARALANDPPIIVADEPTGNLDTANTALIHDLFGTLSSEGKTIVYVTHERDLATHSWIARLHDGHIVAQTEKKREEA